MIHLAIVIAAVAIVAFVAGDAVVKYRATPGTSILTAFEQSASILGTRLLALSSALITAIAGIADYLNAPGIADAVRNMIPSEYVPAFGLAVAIAFELARRRSLGKTEG